ncbi:MAG: hypothetical protein JW832_05275 [Deltaproteobacteria bacterium]|nr:hypothetical protein [Deltaproteobacteria bacterium]
MAATRNLLANKQRRRHSVYVATTLYEVVEAVSAQAHFHEGHLIAPAVLKLLRDCRADFLRRGKAQSC